MGLPNAQQRRSKVIGADHHTSVNRKRLYCLRRPYERCWQLTRRQLMREEADDGVRQRPPQKSGAQVVRRSAGKMRQYQVHKSLLEMPCGQPTAASCSETSVAPRTIPFELRRPAPPKRTLPHNASLTDFPTSSSEGKWPMFSSQPKGSKSANGEALEFGCAEPFFATNTGSSP